MLALSEDVRAEEGLVLAARELVAPLRAAANDINQARAMPLPILEMLREAGLLSMMRPARHGGAQTSLKTVLRVSGELACGDASTAWVHSVYTGHDFLLGRFPEAGQQAFWNSAELPLCASSLVPMGKAVAVDGGWQLTGSWAFCSGIDHADWTIIGAFTGMIAGERPRPQRRLFMVPASQYTIVDDWQVMGLRGTGSKSIVLDAVFVPEEHSVQDQVFDAPLAAREADRPEARYAAWPLMSFALVGLASSIARNAYEGCLVELDAAAGKPNPIFESRRPAAAMQLAEASAEIDAAQLLYERALDDTFAVVDAGEELTMAQRVRNRRDQCYAARLSQTAAARLLNIGGARGLREGGVVQRAYRDLCALTLHPASNWDATAISYGTVAMGGAPTELIV